MALHNDIIVDSSKNAVKMEFEVNGKKVVVTSDQVHQLVSDLSNLSRGETTMEALPCTIQEFKDFIDAYYPDSEPSGPLKSYSKLLFSIEWFASEVLANK